MELRIGDEIPPFRRTTDLMEWNRFAAVNDEFVPFHMDDAAGRALGLPGAIGMGSLRSSYLHSMLRAWIGPNGRIVRLACQHRRYNLRGDTLTCRGRVTAVRENGRLVDLDIWVENGEGDVITPGSATVELPPDRSGK
jgi:acyl dehydratase